MSNIRNSTSPLFPILVCLAGVFLLAAMDAAVKGLVLTIGAYNALLWRSVFGSVAAGTAWKATKRTRPDANALRLHIQRGIVVCFVGLLFFWGVGRLPLAEAVALSFVAPLVALFMVAIMLGERIGRSVILASIMGMVGVVIILLGRFGAGNYAPDALLGVLAILASAFFYAYNLVLTRRQSLIAKPLEVVFFTNLVALVVLGAAAPWFGLWPAPDQWAPIIGVTVLALGGHAMLSWAYGRTEAQYLIPTEYSAFVWAILLGWFFFDEAVGVSTIAGAVLITLGCLLASRSKPKLAEPIEVAAI
nr:DMT family transporter [Mesorhizobium sp.]